MFAGGVGGLCSLVVGYPFDTVKVRLQTESIYKSALDCFKRIIIHEGPVSLFRGISALACVALPRFALMFHTNTVVRNILIKDADSKDNYGKIMLSGALSQLLVVPMIVAPLERIKVILQTNTKVNGQLDCLRHVLKTEGPRGVFKGTLVTYARDMPSFAAYFAVYEFLRNAYFFDPETGIVSISGTLIAGAAAGIAGWTMAIPADVVKNRHQALIQQGSKSALVTAINLYNNDGIKGFFRGAGPILLRAGPANAAAFLGYEAAIVLITLLNQNQNLQ